MVVSVSDSEERLQQATDEYQRAARLGLAEARAARPVVRVAKERVDLLKKVAGDVSAERRRYVKEKRDGEYSYGYYRPVVVEETERGFVKTYYGTYTDDVMKRGYRRKVTKKRVERYDKNGHLVEREVYKDYDRNDDGEERPYLFSREKFVSGKLVERYRQKYDNRSGKLEYRETKNYVTGEVKYKDYRDPAPLQNAPNETVYQVQDVAGKTWRSTDPAFIKEKTGVDPRKVTSGTVVLRESGTGKVFYARQQELNGRQVLIGVGAPANSLLQEIALSSQQSAAAQPVPPQRALLPPEQFLNAQIQNVVRGKPRVSAPEVGLQQEARLALTQPYSQVPVGTPSRLAEAVYSVPMGKRTSYLDVPEEAKPSVQFGDVGFYLGGGSDRVSRGADKLLRARLAFDKGDDLVAAKYAAAGVALKFSGGVRNSFQAAVEDPLTTFGTAAAYGAAGAVAGPGGVGALFTAQNALEAATGQEMSAVRIIRDPVTSAGELALFVAMGALGEEAVGAVKGARLKFQERVMNRRYAGKIVTRDMAGLLAKPPGTDVSAEVQVRPLLYDYQRALSIEAGGAHGTMGARAPILGDPFFIHGSELQNIPKNYAFRALIEKEVTTRPVSSRPFTMEEVFEMQKREGSGFSTMDPREYADLRGINIKEYSPKKMAAIFDRDRAGQYNDGTLGHYNPKTRTISAVDQSKYNIYKKGRILPPETIVRHEAIHAYLRDAGKLDKVVRGKDGKLNLLREEEYVLSQEENARFNFEQPGEFFFTGKTSKVKTAQTGVSAPAQTVRVQERMSGVLSAEELQGVQTPVVRVEAGRGDVSPLLIRETRGRAVVEFQPIDLEGTDEVPKQSSGRSGRRPGSSPRLRIEQGGSMLEKNAGMLEKRGGMIEAQQRYPTGLPLIIENIALRGKGAKPSAGGVAGGGLSVREIVIKRPQKDGTVLQQKIMVIDIEEPVQETKQAQKQETMQKTKQAQKQETMQKTKQAQKQETMQKKKYAVVQAQKLSVEAATGGRFKVRQQSKSKLAMALAQKQAQAQKSTQAQKQAQDAAQKQAQDAAQKQAQDVAQLQSQILKTDQVSLTSSLAVQSSLLTGGSPISRFKNSLVTSDEIFFSQLPNLRPKEPKRERDGFTVLVKNRGKLRPVSIAATAREAFAKAKGLLRSTAKASAQVRDARGRPVKPSALGPEFRTSKKDKTVLVERSKFRINTPGEREEITFKGLRSSKKKKRGGLFGRFF